MLLFPINAANSANALLLYSHTSWIVSMGGGGSLWRHRLTMTQVTLRRKVMGMEGLMKDSRGLTTPKLIT